MSRFPAALPVALTAVALAACGQNTDNAGGNIDVAALSDVAGEWRLVHVYSGPSAPVSDTEITLTLASDSIAVNAGCNQMTAGASVDQGILTLDGPGLASTRMLCAPEVMEQETWVADFVAAEPLLQHGGPVLTLGTDVEGRDIPESEVISLSFERTS